MPRVGRALRWQMADAAAETPERIAYRIRFRAVAERVNAETAERFFYEGFPVTWEHARAAAEWQEARIRELMVEAAR